MVTKDEATKLAAKFGMNYIETSARDGRNCARAISMILDGISLLFLLSVPTSFYLNAKLPILSHPFPHAFLCFPTCFLTYFLTYLKYRSS